MNNKLTILALLACLACSSTTLAKTRVVCVGDSITAGVGADKGQSYPDQLQAILGDGYEVLNCGSAGKTALRGTSRWNLLNKAKAFKPDIVIIKLGTNDSKSKHWHKKSFFKDDLNTHINELLATNRQTKIYLGLPIPAYYGKTAKLRKPDKVPYDPNSKKKGHGNWISGVTIESEIIPLIEQVSKDRKLPIIDFFTPFHDKQKKEGGLSKDGVHPNNKGAGVLADIAANAIKR